MQRFCLFILILASILFVGLIRPEGDHVQGFIEPFTRMHTETDTSGTWTAAGDTIIVYEMRTKDGGKVRLRLADETTYKNIWLTEYDILRARVTHVVLDSCTADTLMFFGYKRY